MNTVHRVRRSLRLAGCSIGLMAAVAAYGAQDTDGTTQKPGASRVAPGTPKPAQPEAGQGVDVKLRRLESLSWNPVTQEMTWVLSTGTLGAKGYTPTKQESYVIHMDQATMSVAGKDRHFDPAEADAVGKVMDLLCRYALESTIWWEHGGVEQPKAAPGTRTATPKDKGQDETIEHREIPPGMLRGWNPTPAGAVQQDAILAARQP
jgi:hypothetical protein